MNDMIHVVVSTRRPQNVAHMIEYMGIDDLIWIVNDDKDRKDYEAEGAHVDSVSDGSTKHENMLLALEAARSAGKLLAQYDDDIFHGFGETFLIDDVITEYPITARNIAIQLRNGIELTGGSLAGSSFQENPLNTAIKVRLWRLVYGAVRVIDPEATDWWMPLSIDMAEDLWHSFRELDRMGIIYCPRWLTMNPRMGVKVIVGDKTKGGMAENRTLDKELRANLDIIKAFPHLAERSPTNPRLRLIPSSKPAYIKEYEKQLNEPDVISAIRSVRQS